MRRLQRQISSVVIVVLLFAALAASFSLSVLLPDRTQPVGPGDIVISPVPGEIPLDPAPSDGGPLVPLVLAGVAAALIPISVSFILDKHVR